MSDNDFGSSKGNSNPMLRDFSDTLEFLIMENLDIASKKTHGDSGLVIAIDAKWGSGKTTFLDMFKDKILYPYEDSRESGYIYSYDFRQRASYNRLNNKIWDASVNLGKKKKVMIINYDAWSNDYFDDPFVSLVGQFCQVDGFESGQLESFKEKASKLALPISKLTVHSALNICAAIPILGRFANVAKDTLQDAEKYIPEIVEKCKENMFTEHLDSFAAISGSVKGFNEALSSLSSTEDKDEVIKIILVDEIDRCKPSFAINLLEIMKHFFSASNTVFIVTMDKHSLSEHIKHYHGHNIDANHYLSRLFDFELKLPTNSGRFYDQLMSKCAGGKNVSDEQLMKQVRKLYGFGPREWQKYFITIQHIRKIPTWNREEVYILLAVRMWNDGNYTALSKLDSKSANSKKDIIANIVPNFSSQSEWQNQKQEVGEVLWTAIDRLIINLVNVNCDKEKICEISENLALGKTEFMGIFATIDYMV